MVTDKWQQTNVFNNYLLRDSIFERLKVGTTLHVKSQCLLLNFNMEREIRDTVQESTETQNTPRYRKIIYAYEQVDTIICGAPLTTNGSITGY